MSVPAETGERPEFQLNGEARSLEGGQTLSSLLASLGRDPRTVAVERNGVIVRRQDFQDYRLQPGDRIEIVHFVQGG